MQHYRTCTQESRFFIAAFSGLKQLCMYSSLVGLIFSLHGLSASLVPLQNVFGWFSHRVVTLHGYRQAEGTVHGYEIAGNQIVS